MTSKVGKGYIGKILRVNLSTGKISEEDLDEKLTSEFIGGRGIASKILWDEVSPEVDPFSPENKLIFATGPLTGTSAPSSGRYTVAAKSPLTGTIGEADSGGFWSVELKKAGYDILILEGKSRKPVYLWIKDRKAELRSAEPLWGKNTHETTDLIQKELGDEKIRVACIGPAGEKLARIACVINEKNRAAGRGGMGAVTGSKNLKAIAVRGRGKIEVAKPKELKEVLKDIRKVMKENPVTGQGLPTFGTAVLVNIINQHGILPTRNFQTGVFEGVEKISGETMKDTILKKATACYGCPIGCGRITEVKKGKYAGNGEGPEYETIWAFGAQCGIDNLEAIAKANYLCNELGLDTISMGNTIGCAMELCERGYLPKKDVGIDLRFGDADAVVELTRKTGLREGFGNLLAEGSFRLAEKYGHPELSMSVKKQELPAYDPRGVQGHGLAYATSNRGGCHLRAYLISPEIIGLPEKIDPFSIEEKPTWVKTFQDLTSVIDSADCCLFTTFAIGAVEYAKMFSAVTGIEVSPEELMKVGERIWNLERLYNLKAGFTKEDDTLPSRLLTEPMPEGAAKGLVHRLNEMLPEYYKIRGWDKDGVPTKEKLRELGL
jgi:aldehyde:ferredoxin oxidoreductase